MSTTKPRTTVPQAWRVAAVVGASVLLLLAGCGDKKKDKVASQTAVKVNKEEITVHQINFVLQQQRGLKPEQAEAAGKQILERLIDQELALQKADELKLDRDPRVVQQLEAAKREIVARAYLEKSRRGRRQAHARRDQEVLRREAGAVQGPPHLQHAGNRHRGQARADRRRCATKLEAAKNINEFVEFLKANDFRFSGNQAVRAAEQLPLDSLDTFAAMKDGQALLVPSPTGAQVVVLAGSRSAAGDAGAGHAGDRAVPAERAQAQDHRART